MSTLQRFLLSIALLGLVGLGGAAGCVCLEGWSVQGELRELVRLRAQLAAAGGGAISADPGNIDQVIINLCINARDTTLDGGRLRLETRNVLVGEDYWAADRTPGRVRSRAWDRAVPPRPRPVCPTGGRRLFNR